VNPRDLLQRLRDEDVRLCVCLAEDPAGEPGIEVDAPEGWLTDERLEELRRHRPDLLAAALAVEARALALLDHLADLVQTPAQRAVLEEYRAVICRYRADLHPLLFEAPDAVNLLAERWEVLATPPEEGR
jgi:hypothetical protein